MKKLLLVLSFVCAGGFVQTHAQSTYKMAGPYEVVARDGQYRGSKGGSERDMRAAWDLAREGKYEEARQIIDAYAEKL